MFDKSFYHKDNLIAELYESFGRYDFKAFYLICDIIDRYQELIRIDLQYDIIRSIAVFCECRTDIVQAGLLLTYI